MFIGMNLFFQWDFGDGSMSMEVSFNYSYMEIGQYNVILIVGNSCDIFIVSQVLNIMVFLIGDWVDLLVFEVFFNFNWGLFIVEVMVVLVEVI